ncbi:MAG: hypothetical protein RI564_08325 [Gracilimonas sp.]|nr:hypothetical protein [Gracilimonas sp.]
MLRKRIKPTSKSMNTDPKPSGSLPVTYITNTTTISGDMICVDDVRIAGTLFGKLESKRRSSSQKQAPLKDQSHPLMWTSPE